METLVASAIGVMSAVGTYLILRRRAFPVILGMTMFSYSINLFLFATGRLVVNAPPILTKGVETYTDPLPQALVLTAIVISFGMTAVTVMMSLGAFITGGDDRIDMPAADLRPGPKALVEAARRATPRIGGKGGRA